MLEGYKFIDITNYPALAELGPNEKVNDYICRHNAGWIEFKKRDILTVEDIKGWKIHISVLDIHSAWPGIVNVLASHGVKNFKVACPKLAAQLSADEAHAQAGKLVVVYDAGDTTWHNLIVEIEEALRNNNSQPGPMVKGDNPILNSNYIYYRNDSDKKGEYFSIDSFKFAVGNPDFAPEGFKPEVPYNPFGFPDPFKNIALVPAVGKIKPAAKRKDFPPP